MTKEGDDAELDPVDRALLEWRQGDCIVGKSWFVHRVEPANPLTDAGRAAAGAGSDLAETSTFGLVVLTQTCDLVRRWRERPYVEVAPLVEVPDRELGEIAKGDRPRYAFMPALADRRLVADLDRVMTVEKSVIARAQRSAGCITDPERRRFAQALARKRERFAFPDDFTALVSRLRDRIKKKHGRASPEGDALQRLREIRVVAAPDWDAQRVRVVLLFIRAERDIDADGVPWDRCLEAWMSLVPAAGRFEVDGLVTTLDRLTAAEYVDSDRLDLDHLTQEAQTPAN